MSQRLSTKLSKLSPEQRRLLGVLACEKKTTLWQVDKLGLSPELSRWVLDSVGHGLLLDGGVAHGRPYTTSFTGERAFTIESSCRSLVLRYLAEQKKLAQVREDGRALFGEQSQSGYVTALYEGTLTLLEREVATYLRRDVHGEETGTLRERLYEAICTEFDPDWLMQTWGDVAPRLVEQVLCDAKVTLRSVEALYQWASSREVGSFGASTERVLAEHAFLRGDVSTLERCCSRLPIAEQPALRAALYVLRGDLLPAQTLLNDSTAKKKSQRLTVSSPISVTVLLALLALGRDLKEGPLLSRRILQRLVTSDVASITGWPLTNEPVAVSRAFRLLSKRMSEPDSERVRLSVHQHSVSAPAWETLLLALTVQLEDCDAVTRLGWTRRLVADGQRWQSAGYRWMARQALHLARALSPDEKVEFEPRLPHESGELLLAYLLEREPEWRRALRALEQFTETAEHRETVVSRRVAWFLDMSCGELAKPALDEYREGSGWSRGQRVDFDVLRAHQSELPPEDIAVLTAIDSAPRLNRIPPEAVEALCGHPRVFNGARGRKPVEVVRGRCRIETAEEHGHFVIRIEPAGAEVGVHVVVENESRVVVYRVDSALAKLIQLIPTGIRIPQSEKREGLAVLSRLAEHVAVDSPELGVLRTVVADSCPCIRISPEAGAWWIEIGVRPFGENGRFFPPGLGKSLVTVHSDEDVLDTERNLNEELRRFNALLEACPTLGAALTREKEASDQSGDPFYTASLDEEELFSLLSELRAKKTDYCLEWKQGRAVSARGKLTASSLQGALRRIKGWYLLDGSVEIDAVTPLALAELVRMPFTKSGRFIRLPTGDFVEVERRVAEVLSRLANVAQLPVQGVAREIKVPEAAVDVLRLLSETESGIVVEAEARDWLARLDSFLAIEPALPDGLRATLRPYQVDGYRWLWRYSQVGLGVCLADDMGLGKTLQVIALLLTRATGGPAIVIAPTSVCSNWLEELRRFAPSLNAVEYVGKSRSALIERFKRDGETRAPDVIIASYALLQQDVTTLATVEWNTAVLDEAQFIKNPHSQRAKAAFALSARYRVAMTGTPIENHLGDLWSVFHFLNPSLLGSLKHFQLRYVKPIERERDSAQQARLKKLVQPFMLRRRKEEVLLDLPSMTVMRHEVRLNDDESMRYALLRRQINEKLRDPAVKRDHKLEVLAEITRLRRFCCHPRLVFPDAPTESSKVQAFLELAEDLRANGHRALVFSQFVDFLGLIREQLDERQVRYLYLDGSTPKDARQVRVQEFQNGDVELFLISLKAGGFGLNLTGADYVIHLDPWWNPAVEAQATDRAHRIGQKRPVTVYRLVTKDSIEERIVELHREKRAIANALLDETSVVTALSSSELMELLSMD